MTTVPPDATPTPTPCHRVHVPEAVLYVVLATVAAATGALVSIRVLGL